ncbi:hypothetical protein JXL19_04930, partial [bacterium]|nr:hypothetical protein [bacterium]
CKKLFSVWDITGSKKISSKTRKKSAKKGLEPVPDSIINNLLVEPGDWIGVFAPGVLSRGRFF